jgi:hypothetical protein
MPIVSAGQVIDKTLFLKRPSNFYRAGDVSLPTPSNPNKNADKAKPISNKLPTGYSFLVDSFLKADAAKNRSNLYWTFFGKDGKYYAIKHDPTLFSFDALKQQGVKTTEEVIKAQEEEKKTPIDKATETLTNLATGAGKTAKNLLYIGAAVFAVGYLLPKFLKK